MTQKTCLVTGSTGQVGSYLCEHLLSLGHKVIGTRRRTSSPSFENVAAILNHPNFELVLADITDFSCVNSLLTTRGVTQVYNLAAQSFVKLSFDSPFHTMDVNTTGVLNFLESIRQNKLDTKFYQASTSEMFGKSYSERMVPNPKCPQNSMTAMQFQEANKYGGVQCDCVAIINEKFQNEDTPFAPMSPYGISKLAAHHLVRLYRESYGVNGACGILFNHESPRRPVDFVTRKITDYVGKLVAHRNKQEFVAYKTIEAARVAQAKHDDSFPKLALGNLDSFRDWGHAKDYARAQYLILQQEKLEDFVICTGETRTVREFCDIAFSCVGLNYEDYVVVDPQYFRPSEVDYLLGNCSKAKRLLGWEPAYSFQELVSEMVSEDIRRHSK